MVELVKNPPAMQETWVRSLGWEDPLEKGKATHSSILVENSMDCTVHRVTKSRIRLSGFHSLAVLCQARTVLGDEDTTVPKRKPCSHGVTF